MGTARPNPSSSTVFVPGTGDEYVFFCFPATAYTSYTDRECVKQSGTRRIYRVVRVPNIVITRRARDGIQDTGSECAETPGYE